MLATAAGAARNAEKGHMNMLAREVAVARLRGIVGRDLRVLADEYGVTVFLSGRLNKGWAGLTLERFLGLSAGNKQIPDTKDWELKLVPLKRVGNMYVPKETMAITMINPEHLIDQDFEHSHLLHKLQSLVVCGREFENREEKHSRLVSVGTFDLANREIRKQ